MSSDVEDHLLSLLNDPYFKGTVAEELTSIRFRDQRTAKLNRSRTCKETFMLVPSVIYAVQDFYLIEAMDLHISNLKSAGLIEYWHSKITDDNNLIVDAYEAPKSLKLQHFVGAFQFWLIGMGVSAAAFVYEFVRKGLNK